MADNHNRVSPKIPGDGFARTQGDGVFEMGAPVQSISGGPVMLVDDVFTMPGRIRCRCVWVEKGQGLRFGDFDGEQLIGVRSNATPVQPPAQ